jgi:hypothetical protein
MTLEKPCLIALDIDTALKQAHNEGKQPTRYAGAIPARQTTPF